jgi:hypothetical protein
MSFLSPKPTETPSALYLKEQTKKQTDTPILTENLPATPSSSERFSFREDICSVLDEFIEHSEHQDTFSSIESAFLNNNIPSVEDLDTPAIPLTTKQFRDTPTEPSFSPILPVPSVNLMENCASCSEELSLLVGDAGDAGKYTECELPFSTSTASSPSASSIHSSTKIVADRDSVTDLAGEVLSGIGMNGGSILVDSNAIFDELMDRYQEMYYLAAKYGVLLVGVVKDSHSIRFSDLLHTLLVNCLCHPETSDLLKTAVRKSKFSKVLLSTQSDSIICSALLPVGTRTIAFSYSNPSCPNPLLETLPGPSYYLPRASSSHILQDCLDPMKAQQPVGTSYEESDDVPFSSIFDEKFERIVPDLNRPRGVRMIRDSSSSSMWKYEGWDGKLLDHVGIFYMRPVPYDAPMRVEFLYPSAPKSGISAYINTIAGILMSLSSYNDECAQPSVLVEADALSKVKQMDVEMVRSWLEEEAGLGSLTLSPWRHNAGRKIFGSFG